MGTVGQTESAQLWASHPHFRALALIWIDVSSETYLKPPNPNSRRLGLSRNGDSSVDMQDTLASLSPCEHRELPVPAPPLSYHLPLRGPHRSWMGGSPLGASWR